MSAEFKKFRNRRAFTLLELMVVLVIIGILIASVFKLFSAVSENSSKAKTKARMERLQNAISGFYSSYGTYPPVPEHLSPDPMNVTSDRGKKSENKNLWNSGDKAKAAELAARSQPVSFEYPTPISYNDAIGKVFGSQQIRSANEVFVNPDTESATKWEDVKMFKFGLMSFLLPRVELVGLPREKTGFNNDQPRPEFYESKQWKHHNTTSRIGSSDKGKLLKALRNQRELEMRECAKWIPNLEGIMSGNAPTIMNTVLAGGGEMADSVGGSSQFRGVYDKDGQNAILFCTTVVDGWGRDFFYYSAPPYQSYRIWSAGADGKTFPPWIPFESLRSELSPKELKEVSEWIKDDIVGFDR